MLIYKVTNIQNGKTYIGQTTRDLNIRKSEHIKSAGNIHRVRYPAPLHQAISTYGKTVFTWEVIEECISCEHMNERERFYIKLLNTMLPNGYNQTVGGSMDDMMSEEVRERIADSMVRVHQDPEYQARNYPKLKGLTPPNKGKPMSEAQKIKVSKAKKAVYADPSYVNPNLGAKRTDQQKSNIKAGQAGNMATGKAWQAAHKDQYTDDVRAKMRAAKLGKKPANTKQVQCIETGEVFNGLTEAANTLGVNRQSIYMQIKGKLKSAGGKHFRYV